MEEPSDAGVDEDEERVLKLLLQEEERLQEVKRKAPPKEVPELPLGSIVLALEEIDRGLVGLAVFQGREIQIQALELIHRYANAIVVVRPNLVKEYGSVGGTIKAPRRTILDFKDISTGIDETITEERQIQISKLLGDRIPRYIRLFVDQDCTLEFETPRQERTTFPGGLDATVPAEIQDEAWITIWITPVRSTKLQMYASTSSAVGRE